MVQEEFMKKEKFVFNQKTLEYEVYKAPVKYRLFKNLGLLLVASCIVLGAQDYFSSNNLSPKEQMLKRELDQMKYNYSVLNEQMDMMTEDLTSLHSRGSKIQELIFGTKPLDDTEWLMGIGGTDRYKNIVKYANTGDLLVGTLSKADLLKRQLDIQVETLKKLEKLAVNRDDYLESIPSIKPVAETDVTKGLDLLSGFGMRLHPIHRIVRMHTGIDFPAPVGTEVRAAGRGKVVKVASEGAGYGKYIVVDHGFEYKTLYAHLQGFKVKEGQEVVKGQIIGTVGNSGTSTAPHLHYEVRINDNPVDPIDYCMDGLTPAEYQRLVKAASTPNMTFD